MNITFLSLLIDENHYLSLIRTSANDLLFSYIDTRLLTMFTFMSNNSRVPEHEHIF